VSALEKLRKMAMGDIDREIEELRNNFKEMLSEIRKMNKTLTEIRNLLKKMVKV